MASDRCVSQVGIRVHGASVERAQKYRRHSDCSAAEEHEIHQTPSLTASTASDFPHREIAPQLFGRPVDGGSVPVAPHGSGQRRRKLLRHIGEGLSSGTRKVQMRASTVFRRKSDNELYSRWRCLGLSRFEGCEHPRENATFCLLIFTTFFLLEVFVNYDSGAIPAALSIISTEFELTSTWQGTLGALPYVGLTIASPVVGRILSKYSPKQVIVWTMTLNIVASVQLTVSVSSWMLLSSRLLCGLTQAAFVIYAPVWVDEFAPPEKVTLWMGLIQGATVVGVTVGYLASGFISHYGQNWRWAVVIQNVFLTVFVVAVCYFPIELVDPSAKEKDQPADKSHDAESNAGEVSRFQGTSSENRSPTVTLKYGKVFPSDDQTTLTQGSRDVAKGAHNVCTSVVVDPKAEEAFSALEHGRSCFSGSCGSVTPVAGSEAQRTGSKKTLAGECILATAVRDSIPKNGTSKVDLSCRSSENSGAIQGPSAITKVPREEKRPEIRSENPALPEGLRDWEVARPRGSEFHSSAVHCPPPLARETILADRRRPRGDSSARSSRSVEERNASLQTVELAATDGKISSREDNAGTCLQTPGCPSAADTHFARLSHTGAEPGRRMSQDSGSEASSHTANDFAGFRGDTFDVSSKECEEKISLPVVAESRHQFVSETTNEARERSSEKQTGKATESNSLNHMGAGGGVVERGSGLSSTKSTGQPTHDTHNDVPESTLDGPGEAANPSQQFGENGGYMYHSFVATTPAGAVFEAMQVAAAGKNPLEYHSESSGGPTGTLRGGTCRPSPVREIQLVVRREVSIEPEEIDLSSPSSPPESEIGGVVKDNGGIRDSSGENSTGTCRGRRGSAMQTQKRKSTSFWDSIRALLSSPVYVWTVFTLCALLFVVTGIQFWATKFFTEYLRVEPWVAMVSFSVTAATAPTAGVLSGGYVIDKIGGYKSENGMFRSLFACSFAASLAVASGVTAGFLDEYCGVIACIWFLLFFGGALLPPLTGILIAAVEMELRTFASGFSMFLYNVFGYALGTFLPGAVMDVFRTSEIVGIRLILFWSIFGLVGVVFAALSAQRLHLKAEFRTIQDAEKFTSHAISPWYDPADVFRNEENEIDFTIYKTETDADVADSEEWRRSPC